MACAFLGRSRMLSRASAIAGQSMALHKRAFRKRTCSATYATREVARLSREDREQTRLAYQRSLQTARDRSVARTCGPSKHFLHHSGEDWARLVEYLSRKDPFSMVVTVDHDRAAFVRAQL
jgi:hypothetical protein